MLQRRKDFAFGLPVIEDGADVIGVRLCGGERSEARLVICLIPELSMGFNPVPYFVTDIVIAALFCCPPPPPHTHTHKLDSYCVNWAYFSVVGEVGILQCSWRRAYFSAVDELSILGLRLATVVADRRFKEKGCLPANRETDVCGATRISQSTFGSFSQAIPAWLWILATRGYRETKNVIQSNLSEVPR